MRDISEMPPRDRISEVGGSTGTTIVLLNGDVMRVHVDDRRDDVTADMLRNSIDDYFSFI